jgi:hypothetical protein
MNQSGAITDKAKELNTPPNAWPSARELADRQDERRLMLQFLPADRFLDQEHLNACAAGDHGGPNDPYRQMILRKAGAAVSGQLMLRPHEFEEYLAHVRDPQTR